MNKQSKSCGLPQESHRWIRNACTNCGIAWFRWADNTIKELQRQVAELTTVPPDGKSRRSPAEEAVIDDLYRRKDEFKPTHAYATVTQPVFLNQWNGKHHPSVEANIVKKEVPAGTTLKIVMVSRFGDCGLTDDLNAENGYTLRVDFDSEVINNIRWNP